MRKDARKLKIPAQQELRKSGMSYQDIGKILEVHYTTVSTWYAKYMKEVMKDILIESEAEKMELKET